MAEYPSGLLGLYVSLLPALMPILGCPNFCFEWSGRTSTGKTTALRFAASVWGDPQSVPTWLRPRPPVTGRPMILDDTNCAHPETPVRTVYRVTSDPVQTVLMSTGEKPIIAFAKGGGVLARVISLPGSPFGKDDRQTSQDVAEVCRIITQNYGYLGEMFEHKLQDNQQYHEIYRETYQSIDRAFRSHAILSGGIADRLAGYAAAIKMTADLAHSFFPEMDWSPGPVIQALWLWIVTHGCADDQAYKAAMEVKDWVDEHLSLFWDKDKTRPEPEKGWAGRWDGDGPLYFFPAYLRKLLESLDYDGTRTMKEWRGRGWIQNGETRLNPRVSLDSHIYSLALFRPPAPREVETFL